MCSSLRPASAEAAWLSRSARSRVVVRGSRSSRVSSPARARPATSAPAQDHADRSVDLVRDPRDELAERRHLLGLHEAGLRGLELVQRFGLEPDLEVLQSGPALFAEDFFLDALELPLVMERALEVAPGLIGARQPLVGSVDLRARAGGLRVPEGAVEVVDGVVHPGRLEAQPTEIQQARGLGERVSDLAPEGERALQVLARRLEVAALEVEDAEVVQGPGLRDLVPLLPAELRGSAGCSRGRRRGCRAAPRPRRCRSGLDRRRSCRPDHGTARAPSSDRTATSRDPRWSRRPRRGTRGPRRRARSRPAPRARDGTRAGDGSRARSRRAPSTRARIRCARGRHRARRRPTRTARTLPCSS